MDHTSLVTTRRALHAVAELVIAGPQYVAEGDIRLRVVPGGFAGMASAIRVEGPDLVWDSGHVTLGGTCRELADAVGVTVGAPDVYREGSGVDPDQVLSFDAEALTLLLGWFVRGDEALRTFAPEEERVLWPEHFDVGYTLDEVNFGVSPGDDAHPAPYAYVGPWRPRGSGRRLITSPGRKGPPLRSSRNDTPPLLTSRHDTSSGGQQPVREKGYGPTTPAVGVGRVGRRGPPENRPTLTPSAR